MDGSEDGKPPAISTPPLPGDMGSPPSMLLRSGRKKKRDRSRGRSRETSTNGRSLSSAAEDSTGATPDRKRPAGVFGGTNGGEIASDDESEWDGEYLNSSKKRMKGPSNGDSPYPPKGSASASAFASASASAFASADNKDGSESDEDMENGDESGSSHGDGSENDGSTDTNDEDMEEAECNAGEEGIAAAPRPLEVPAARAAKTRPAAAASAPAPAFLSPPRPEREVPLPPRKRPNLASANLLPRVKLSLPSERPPPKIATAVAAAAVRRAPMPSDGAYGGYRRLVLTEAEVAAVEAKRKKKKKRRSSSKEMSPRRTSSKERRNGRRMSSADEVRREKEVTTRVTSFSLPLLVCLAAGVVALFFMLTPRTPLIELGAMMTLSALDRTGIWGVVLDSAQTMDAGADITPLAHDDGDGNSKKLTEEAGSRVTPLTALKEHDGVVVEEDPAAGMEERGEAATDAVESDAEEKREEEGLMTPEQIGTTHDAAKSADGEVDLRRQNDGIIAEENPATKTEKPEEATTGMVESDAEDDGVIPEEEPTTGTEVRREGTTGVVEFDAEDAEEKLGEEELTALEDIGTTHDAAKSADGEVDLIKQNGGVIVEEEPATGTEEREEFTTGAVEFDAEKAEVKRDEEKRDEERPGPTGPALICDHDVQVASEGRTKEAEENQATERDSPDGNEYIAKKIDEDIGLEGVGPDRYDYNQGVDAVGAGDVTEEKGQTEVPNAPNSEEEDAKVMAGSTFDGDAMVEKAFRKEEEPKSTTAAESIKETETEVGVTMDSRIVDGPATGMEERTPEAPDIVKATKTATPEAGVDHTDDVIVENPVGGEDEGMDEEDEEEEEEEEEELEPEVITEEIRVKMIVYNDIPDPALFERERKIRHHRFNAELAVLERERQEQERQERQKWLAEHKRRQDLKQIGRFQSKVALVVKEEEEGQRHLAKAEGMLEIIHNWLEDANMKLKDTRNEMGMWENLLTAAELSMTKLEEDKSKGQEAPDVKKFQAATEALSKLAEQSPIPFAASAVNAAAINIPGEACQGMDYIIAGDNDIEATIGSLKKKAKFDDADPKLQIEEVERARSDLTRLANSTALVLMKDPNYVTLIQKWVEEEVIWARAEHPLKYLNEVETDAPTVADLEQPGMKLESAQAQIERLLENHVADGTGQYDFASLRGGASIVHTGLRRTSPSFVDNLPLLNRALAAVRLRFYGHGPEAALSPTYPRNALGQCWAFEPRKEGIKSSTGRSRATDEEEDVTGDYATLTVNLAARVYVEGVSIEHPPMELSPTPGTAIREFRVFGYESLGGAGEPWFLGSFRYDIGEYRAIDLTLFLLH